MVFACSVLRARVESLCSPLAIFLSFFIAMLYVFSFTLSNPNFFFFIVLIVEVVYSRASRSSMVAQARERKAAHLLSGRAPRSITLPGGV